MALEKHPADPNYGGDRLRLFNVEGSPSFSIKEFEKKWKEVDNVWVQFGATKMLKKDPNGWTKNYDCRFRKRRSSSSKNPEIPVEKQRKTSTRDSNLCEAQITITLRNGIVSVRKTHPDGPDHTHDLRASDMIKRPSEMIEFVKEEATKGYRAPAIQGATFNRFNEKEMGVEFLQLQTVLNVQHKVRGGLDVPFIGPLKLAEDIKSSLEWLQSKDYKTEIFYEKDYQGFAFADELNLETLRKSGHLVLMDSTHKTNKHDWKLYTLLVRDAFGSWLPGGHFFVSGEEHNIVAKGLGILKGWAASWTPRYFIIDMSAIEENAVEQTFRGLIAGEQEVGIFYCTWHSRKALQRNLESFGKGYELMLQAMYKITRIGCEQLIQEAMARLPLEQKKNYIRRYWLSKTAKWALWSRQHSPLLLQTTTTSPVESYHAVLKKKGNGAFGLIGACMTVVTANEGYYNRALRTRLEFRTKNLTEVDTYPFLIGFPYPVQLLLIDEIRASEKRVEEGKEIPEFNSPECYCQFFRRYLLPCRHIFHRDHNREFLTDDDWKLFRNIFAESGFDVYISRMRVAVEREEDPREVEAEQHRLEFYAAMEEVRERWFELEAIYRRTGDAGPLNHIVEQIHGIRFQQMGEEGQ